VELIDPRCSSLEDEVIDAISRHSFVAGLLSVKCKVSIKLRWDSTLGGIRESWRWEDR
jgi:hypothetical protein